VSGVSTSAINLPAAGGSRVTEISDETSPSTSLGAHSAPYNASSTINNTNKQRRPSLTDDTHVVHRQTPW